MKLWGLMEDLKTHEAAKNFWDRRSYKNFTADFDFWLWASKKQGSPSWNFMKIWHKLLITIVYLAIKFLVSRMKNMICGSIFVNPTFSKIIKTPISRKRLVLELWFCAQSIQRVRFWGGSPHIHFSPTPSLFELSAIYGLEARGDKGGARLP